MKAVNTPFEQQTDVTADTDAMLMLRLYRAELEAIYSAKTKARIIGEKFLDIMRHVDVPPWFRCGWLEDLEQAVRLNKHDDMAKFHREGLLNLMFGEDGFWKKHKIDISQLCFHGYDKYGCDIHLTAHGEEYILYIPIYEHIKSDVKLSAEMPLAEYDYQFKCHVLNREKSSEHCHDYDFVDGKSAYASFDYMVPCKAIRAAIEASAKKRGKKHGVR